MNGTLTRQMMDDFERDGYCVVEGLITADQVEELLSDYLKAVSGEIEVPTWGDDHVQGKLVQLAKPSRYIEHWQRHDYFVGALAIAKQLMGDAMEYAYDQIIMKPPHYPAETPWHQDAGYWRENPGADRGLTCWLALSPSTLENGCMQFIPASHKGEILPHDKVAHRAEINAALEAAVDASRAVAVELKPGDATFHHCRTLHYTGGNNTPEPRSGLITHFWPPA